jgi:hypothetical protein
MFFSVLFPILFTLLASNTPSYMFHDMYVSPNTSISSSVTDMYRISTDFLDHL